MNFKMQDKQNQLIERISDTHLIVGVDITQQLHVARAVNFREIVVGDPLIFENNEEGFVKLVNWIQNLKRQKNLDTAIVGMEPTGHYWINIKSSLYLFGCYFLKHFYISMFALHFSCLIILI